MAFAIVLVFFGLALQLQFNSKFVDFGQHVIHSEMAIHAKSIEPALIAFEVLRNSFDADILDCVGW